VASIVWLLATIVWVVLGLYVYVALIRQISVRTPVVADPPTKTFGIPEAIGAALLMSLLVVGLINGNASNPTELKLNTQDVINNFILTAVVVLVLAAFLAFRGFNLDTLAGLSKVGIVRVVAIGVILLLMAYPLVLLAETIVQRVFGEASTRQDVVELFSGSRTIQQRIMIILLAVGVAPVAEELVFRFFLYGVIRRYFGVVVGLLLNAILFAAVHHHLPSFAPLFVLGSCFTLAYEWSGSILVPMTMHSLFNSVTLVVLAFPSLVQR
jgi:CAAX protease family protein